MLLLIIIILNVNITNVIHLFILILPLLIINNNCLLVNTYKDYLKMHFL